jgi:hypothetical protein
MHLLEPPLGSNEALRTVLGVGDLVDIASYLIAFVAHDVARRFLLP